MFYSDCFQPEMLGQAHTLATLHRTIIWILFITLAIKNNKLLAQKLYEMVQIKCYKCSN